MCICCLIDSDKPELCIIRIKETGYLHARSQFDLNGVSVQTSFMSKSMSMPELCGSVLSAKYYSCARVYLPVCVCLKRV